MDSLNRSIQLSRAAASLVVSIQVVSQWLLFLEENDGSERKKSVFQQRLAWDTYVANNKDRPIFKRHLRMTYESFRSLLLLINGHMKDVDKKMAHIRGGEVIKELRLYAAIRYMAGASYSDICFFCGISQSTFYRVLWETIHAINLSIKIEFPTTAQECAVVASGFERKSYRSVLKNVVGALDGYLVHIVTPKKTKNRNVRSYFSGHYQKYGINIQACCDAESRFTFMGVGGPGVIKDRSALKESGLHDKVESLPQGYVVIGDCAYQATEKLVPIFGGNLALVPKNDNFNYFASQLRIRIEMAFGLMTRKWGILQRPLSNAPENVKHIILCIARLHNFCVDERLKKNNRNKDHYYDTGSNRLDPEQQAYMDLAAEAEHEDIISNEFPQWSRARERLVQIVKDLGYTRPTKSSGKRKRD